MILKSENLTLLIEQDDKTVYMSVLHQDESLRTDENNIKVFKASNGAVIHSQAYPDVFPFGIYIRGCNKQKDNHVEKFSLKSAQEATTYIEKVKVAFTEFVANNYFEGKPSYKRWRAEIGKPYCFVNDKGEIRLKVEFGTETDNYRYKTENYAQTKEEIEFKEAKKLLAVEVEDWINSANEWKEPCDFERSFYYISNFCGEANLMIGECYKNPFRFFTEAKATEFAELYFEKLLKYGLI